MKKIFTLAFCTVATLSALAEGFTPESGVWYRLLNKETGGDRENSYLGYYPQTEWYVYDQTTGSRDNLVTNPFIASGNEATEDNADEAQINGQLWQFIAGEDGKYCLVNKAYPNGAISKVIVTSDGQPGGNGLNPTRWQYLEDRNADTENICWFDWSSEPSEKDDITYYQPTFENYIDESGKYMALAAGGQKRQIIRVNTPGEASTWWAPIVAEVEDADSINEINAENGDNVIYNLLGRRVSKAVKGIYIINGKKTLVK